MYIPEPLFDERLHFAGRKSVNKRNHDDQDNANGDGDAEVKEFGQLLKAVKICCGSNFTVAIEPGII